MDNNNISKLNSVHLVFKIKRKIYQKLKYLHQHTKVQGQIQRMLMNFKVKFKKSFQKIRI